MMIAMVQTNLYIDFQLYKNMIFHHRMNMNIDMKL